MPELKVIILCNNPISIPGIKEFLFYRKVGAIVTTHRNLEMQEILGELMKDTGVPLLLVDKKDCNKILEESISKYEITAGLIMTFPFILPKNIIDAPARGFINFHYGLLPQCRGPHPIIWHLLNNDAEAGVTLHRLDEGIDTGPVILQEKIPIAADDTYGILQSKLAHTGAKAAATLLKVLSYGSTVPATGQDESKAKYFKKPTARDLTLNWKTMGSENIIRIINACNPWNKAAATIINNWMFGITEAVVSERPANEADAAGTIVALDEQNGLLVKTCDGKLIKINIIYLQEGFFSGHRLAAFGAQQGHCFE